MTTLQKFGLAASIAVAAVAGLEAQATDSEMAFYAQSGAAARAASDKAEAAYKRAMKALDSRQWDQAIAGFNELTSPPNPRADAALYWKAYALNKANRKAEALAAIAQLEKEHAESKWVNDARALELDLRQAAGQNPSPDAEPDEDLKLMALNGLMNSDPEKAIPYLEKILKSSNGPKLKERALFILAQSGSPRARQMLIDIARGGGNLDLQLKAVQNLALFGGAENRKTMQDIYRSSAEARVKRAILQGYMLSGDKADLLAVAREEKSSELRRDAIQQLGLMGAQPEIWQMYQGESSPEVKRAVLQAMFLGGNADRLIELARNEKDPTLRRAAIQNLGLMGSKKTADALVALYGSETEKDSRKHILNALFLQGNAKPLIEIARKETDPELKREAVQKLSLMGSKEGTEYLMELLNK